MQVPARQDLPANLGRLIDEAVPGRRGLQAWRALLEAHATVMRQLQTDLVNKTGLDLNDFDVISQLAHAGGALRMTEHLEENTHATQVSLNDREAQSLLAT
jgi:hypothetical protein